MGDYRRNLLVCLRRVRDRALLWMRAREGGCPGIAPFPGHTRVLPLYGIAKELELLPNVASTGISARAVMQGYLGLAPSTRRNEADFTCLL